MIHTYENFTDILKLAKLAENLPVAVVDLDAFDRNLKSVADLLKGTNKTLRVASKSIRVPALLKRVLDFGGPYKGIMAYSAQEAAWLCLELEFDDVLVAYPTIQKQDLAALRAVHDAGKKVILAVDSIEGLQALSDAMQGAAQPFPIVIDIDVSTRFFAGLIHIGVRRSPVRSLRDLEKMIREVAKFSQLKLCGALAYEAQVAGFTDHNPFKKWLNPIAKILRKLSAEMVANQRLHIARFFNSQGATLEVFNGGGTGSLNFANKEPHLTELSAGSALLSPHLFDYYTNIRFEPACFFALQVVRKSDSNYVTCQGGGYTASGAAGRDRLPIAVWPSGLQLLGTEGAGEVQTPLKGAAARSLKLGDPVFFRHSKAGELAEHFNDYLLIQDNQPSLRAKTYRGLGKRFF